jgi:endonuclease/exonuclease/phosphatase family metal-dependent hydrolase
VTSFVFLVACATVVDAGTGVAVRVVTFNIENLSSTGTSQFAAAVDSLERVCADVVCVQEMQSTTIASALAAAAGYPHVVVASNSNAIDTSLRSAIFSVFPFSDSGTETSITLSSDATARDLTRNFVFASVVVPGAAEELFVVANHWKAGTADADEFRRSVESIRAMQAVDGFDANVIPIVIAGDLNDDIDDSPDSPAQFFSLPSGLPLSFELGADISFPVINSVFSPLQNAGCASSVSVVDALQLDGNDATRPASGRRLDYLWVSDAIEVVGSEVYDSVDDTLIGGGLPKCGAVPPQSTSGTASDHLPVFMDIEVVETLAESACCKGGACSLQTAESCACAGGELFVGEVCGQVDCGEPPAVLISEIRIDQPGADLEEYFELAGDPGTDLSVITYVVIGDDAAGQLGSGVVEAAIPLTGQFIGSSGFFVAGEASLSLAVPDLVTNLPFENADNVTHMLVTSWKGAIDDDLDTNDDGVLEVQPWDQLIDLIAVIREENPPVVTEYHYGPPTVGPDGAAAPSHVLLCDSDSSSWVVGATEPAIGIDTPGAENDCPGACCHPDGCDDVSNSAACDALGGEYQGVDTTCAGVSCPTFGACCVLGVCADGVTFDSCAAAGGLYQGDDTTCGAVNCPSGACCFAQTCNDGSAEGTCIDSGGIYLGDDSTCTVETCEVSILINELRIDSPGATDEEFVEIIGSGGASLDGISYLVIGDGVGGSGSVEAVLDLSGFVIPEDGFFVMAESGFSLGTPDAIVNLNFEDNDNVTHFLVSGFTGGLGQDLDPNDDGVLDVTPWEAEVDRIALIEEENPPTGTEFHYGPPTVGPDGGSVPSQAYRCGIVEAAWRIGESDPVAGTDSPGTANMGCPAGSCCQPGGTCVDGVLEGNCANASANWQEGADCSDTVCISIPTVSTWGLAVMSGLLLVFGTVILGNRGFAR